MAKRAHITPEAFALYDTPPTGPADAPFTDPAAHLARIKIHTALAYLQVAKEITVTVTHAAVPRPSYTWDWSSWSFNWFPIAYSADRLLGTHGLGIVPFAIVAVGQNIVEPGVPVQTNGVGGARYVHLYLTDTDVRCFETVDSGNADLPAVTVTYRILILREPVALGSGINFNASTDRIQAGDGWFDSDYHYLRAVASGETPFLITGSQNIDTDGGICRIIGAQGAVSHDFWQVSDYAGSLTSVVAQQVQR